MDGSDHILFPRKLRISWHLVPPPFQQVTVRKQNIEIKKFEIGKIMGFSTCLHTDRGDMASKKFTW